MFVICSVFTLCYHTSMRREAKKGSQIQWTEEQLREGFLSFNSEFGRMPTAHEIDIYPYLPSSRSIQRTFGGLVAVRRKLFPEGVYNYTKGEYRQQIASKTFRRSQDDEENFFYELTKVFHEIAIHEHKIIRPGRVTSDFYIYLNDDKGIVIDLFYAQDIFSLQGVVNIKVKRYKILQNEQIIFVCVGGKVNQNQINAMLLSKKTTIPNNIKIVTETIFWSDTLKTLTKLSKYER